MCEIDVHDPLGVLRRNEVDIIVNWQVLTDPDLTLGPTIECRQRILAVGTHHRLSSRPSVSVEELADEKLHAAVPETFPASILDALYPHHTPSGRPIPRVERPSGPVQSVQEMLHRVAMGEIAQPTVAGLPVWSRDDIVLVPIHDLPPMPLGLIWCTTHENARIRALAQTARSIGNPVHAGG